MSWLTTPLPGTWEVWSSVRRTPAALTLYAFFGIVLFGASVVLVMVGKTVPVTVDGKTEKVSSFAGDVGAALDAAGIEYGPGDRVTPPPNTPLGEDTRITVTHARKLELTVNGRTSVRWVRANTVGQALARLGLDPSGAALSAPRSQPLPRSGFSLTVRAPRTVTVETGNGRIQRTVTARTVRQALAASGIALAERDMVNTKLDAPVKPGQVIEITPVVDPPKTKTKRVERKTKRKPSPELPAGESKVVRGGRSGIKKVTVATVMENGEKVRRVLDQRVVRDPKKRIVKEGTQPAAEVDLPAIESAGGLNWAALARCESSGNPNAVNPAGPYYGLYQFDIRTWRAYGGEGNPADASPAQQTKIAKRLYQSRGAQPWPECGGNL